MNDAEPRIPTIGDPFPELKVNTTQGEMVLPDAFKDRWFVLFSHPGDFTPVCTTEFIGFEKLRPEFEKMNTYLIGLSVDQVFAHLKWLEWIREKMNVQIQFPVIADSIGRVSRRLGMIHPEKGVRTVRSVFIVDDRGKIRLILQYPAEVGRNLYEIMRAVHALQTATKYKVATPANWPNSEIIGGNVIVPPAENVQQIIERNQQAQAQEIACFDWWFCYREL